MRRRATAIRRPTPGPLGREVAPWGMVAPYGFRRGSGRDALVEDTDPLSRLEGKTSAEFYRAAEATCPPLAYGREVVENRVIAEGWVVEPGEAGGRDAKELRDWTAAWLGRRELRLTPTLPLLTAYLFYGWHPYQQLWGDWTWSRTVTSRRSGRRFKVPSAVIEKDGRMFRFNVARDLVFTGWGGPYEVMPITAPGRKGEVARMRWLTPRRGSEDVPYGRGIYRTSGAGAAYLLWRDLWQKWQRGIDRSMGILLVERTAETIAARISDEELRAQLEATVDYLNSTGILSPPEGARMRWLENTAAYADGWVDPLDRLEALIALSVTGQGLSIGIGRGGSGSRAAAEVEEGRSARWGRGYAIDLAETITACMIDPAVRWNWGNVPDDLRPKFVFRSSRSVDPALLTVYVDLFSGDPSADPPDAQGIADEWGIPTRRDGEWSARPTEAAPVLPALPAATVAGDENREDPEEDGGEEAA